MKWFRTQLLILLSRLNAWLIEESPALPPAAPPRSPFDEARQRELRVLQLVADGTWRWEWRAPRSANPQVLELRLYDGGRLRAAIGPCTGKPGELDAALRDLHAQPWCPAFLPPVPSWPQGLGAFEDRS